MTRSVSHMTCARSFAHRDEEGQGLAEYALILALIAIVAIVALIFLGSQVSDKLSIIGSTVEFRRSLTERHRRDHTARPAPDRRVFRIPGSDPRRHRPDTGIRPNLAINLALSVDFLPFPPNGPSPLV